MSYKSPINKRLTESQRIALENYKERTEKNIQIFLSNYLAVAGVIILLLNIIIALLAPMIAPYDPSVPAQGPGGTVSQLEPPSQQHLMGTDQLGRDVFSQWVYGHRISLLVALVAGSMIFTIGSTLGIVSGYFGGLVDLGVMRIVDILQSIPALPLIVLFAGLLGNSIWVVTLGAGLFLWRTLARLVRAQTLSVRERPFIKTARAAGASDLRIMYAHVFPNVLPLILLQTTLLMGGSILLEASVSFLGFGANQISWGVMLQLIFATGALEAWWWLLPPGISISLLVLSFIYISRGIEDIANPDLEDQVR